MSGTVAGELESIPQEIPDAYIESGIGKKILVNQYERNPIARRRCLEIYGKCCLICGFDAAEIYGKDFEGKIEVHHIVPINELKQDYLVDPARDLIPICPNCHTILHTKMKNGNYPTIELLRIKIAQNKNKNN
jgi:5-methylcytosine-specific restriction protein A